LLLAAIIRWFVLTIDLPLIERQLYAVHPRGLPDLWPGVAAPPAQRLRRAIHTTTHSGIASGESIALVSTSPACLPDVLVNCAGGIAALAYLGIDATAALAGLGIGVSPLHSPPRDAGKTHRRSSRSSSTRHVRVADFLKLGDTFGTVDRVGLRSTRIRTLDRTIVSVPNGQIATANIENAGQKNRDKFWFRHVSASDTHDTEQVRQIVSGFASCSLEGLASKSNPCAPVSSESHPRRSTSRSCRTSSRQTGHPSSRFRRGCCSASWKSSRSGSSLAFPSQTVHLADDREPARAPDPVVAEADSTGSNPDSARLASAAPSDSARNLAHAICGCVRPPNPHIATGDHVLGSHQPGKPLNPFGDELRVIR
jgi:hypothetical protein